MIYESFGEKDTFELGKKFGTRVKAGDICLLHGDLGVGKTVFTKGFAVGIGIKEPITSPTFTLIQEYGEGRIPLYHFDVYRIGDVEEMEEIGYEDYFYGDGFTMVEWADLILELMPPGYQKITIEKDLEKGFDYRRIVLSKPGREIV